MNSKKSSNRTREWTAASKRQSIMWSLFRTRYQRTHCVESHKTSRSWAWSRRCTIGLCSLIGNMKHRRALTHKTWIQQWKNWKLSESKWSSRDWYRTLAGSSDIFSCISFKNYTLKTSLSSILKCRLRKTRTSRRMNLLSSLNIASSLRRWSSSSYQARLPIWNKS